jgi:hypothetical protein
VFGGYFVGRFAEIDSNVYIPRSSLGYERAVPNANTDPGMTSVLSLIILRIPSTSDGSNSLWTVLPSPSSNRITFDSSINAIHPPIA